MLIQLNPILHVITPLGKANAHFLKYTDDDHYAIFGVFQVATGESWWWPSKQIRLDTSITGEHTNLSTIGPVDGLEDHKDRHGPNNDCEDLRDLPQQEDRPPDWCSLLRVLADADRDGVH